MRRAMLRVTLLQANAGASLVLVLPLHSIDAFLVYALSFKL